MFVYDKPIQWYNGKGTHTFSWNIYIVYGALSPLACIEFKICIAPEEASVHVWTHFAHTANFVYADKCNYLVYAQSYIMQIGKCANG